ncbi:hypothetical protein [Weissella koreensis]
MDYQTDNRKKQFWLTEQGVQKANKFSELKNYLIK